MQAAKRETDEKVARGREDYDEDEAEEEEEENEEEEEEEVEEGCGRGPVSTSAWRNGSFIPRQAIEDTPVNGILMHVNARIRVYVWRM